ncbi:LysR family transcriptional regulator [Bradyrhizobium sp. SZCCHNS3002]|uniref:LysR family transcriptional regulator n=1 Tax=Bradyrhizobium sp. SZCCHNS3002 TaxID=3057310 RepID=UPI0028E6A0F2|nr:LysR family transcriptional regulator [Bradyrhizobium sp. SZCCHNS3002]
MPDKKLTDDLDWEDVRYFLALGRHCSLSATARALRVTHATVSRRVTRLEALLGRPLFERRAGGYSLTLDGKAVFDEATAMDNAASSVLRRLDESTGLSGLVRLTAGRSLAEGFLVERLDGLRRRHPAIDIEIIGDVRLLSLARGEADLALRFGKPKNSELAARRVGTIAFGLYIASSLRYGSDVATRLPLIGFDKAGDSIAEAEWLARHFAGRRFSFRGNSQAAQAAAARAGFGIALLPRYLAANDPRLAEIACDKPLLERELWLLFRSDLRRVARVRAVADYLIELFRREGPRFLGSSEFLDGRAADLADIGPSRARENADPDLRQ